MGLDQAVTHRRLVAGVGFRQGTPADAIVALIRRAIAEAAPEDRLSAIATAADRAAESAIREAAAAFGLIPLPVAADALGRVDSRVPTRSARIERSRGVGSLAEAAALAIAGEDGRLILARIDDGRATCALALMGRTATAKGGAKSEALNHRASPPPSAGGGTCVLCADGQAATAFAPERASTTQIVTPNA